MRKLSFATLLSAALLSLATLSAPAQAHDRGRPGHGYHGHPGYHPPNHDRARAYRHAQREYQRHLEWQQRQAWRARHHGYGLRDSDGDGVPNRYDHRPHNPYRY